MSDIEWNATLHWVRTWKSFVQIFLWELLEYFFLSAKMFWKELTVNLKINHEGLLWEGLQCADIFTSVPDDNQWRNECEMRTLTKRPVTIQDPAYLACTFSMTRAQFVGFWTTIEYLKTCIICYVMMSCVRVPGWRTWGPRRMSCCPVWAGPWWSCPCPQTRTPWSPDERTVLIESL